MLKELESINFPQYRKYLNGKSYFKIHSMAVFEELQLIGTKKIITKHEVKILPDRNFLYDLLLNFKEFAVAIAEEEYIMAIEK